jgi:hypothetical protein
MSTNRLSVAAMYTAWKLVSDTYGSLPRLAHLLDDKSTIAMAHEDDWFFLILYQCQFKRIKGNTHSFRSLQRHQQFLSCNPGSYSRSVKKPVGIVVEFEDAGVLKVYRDEVNQPVHSSWTPG